jgi:exodeoxyribonuclease V alpha subunit
MLNLELQAALNGDESRRTIGRLDGPIGWATSVQTANDYDKDVFNGDIGFVRTVDLDAQETVIDFDERSVTYDFGEIDEVSPAYATTIHKAQGSEYPAVVIPLATQHYLMLRCNLVYTRYHTRRAAGRARRPAPGLGDRGEGFTRPNQVVEA